MQPSSHCQPVARIFHCWQTTRVSEGGNHYFKKINESESERRDEPSQ